MSVFLPALAFTPAVFAGNELGDDASDRRHGRPLAVIPRHVVAGFLESERDTMDSGVFLKCGIELVIACAVLKLLGRPV